MAEKKKRHPLMMLLKLAVVVVALGLGYKYGFGPLLTAKRNQPSEIYVVNDTAQGYDLSFGWRRLSRVLHPEGYVHFQLYVGMPETHTLTLTPEGGGSPKKIKVPLEPDCVLLVNVDRATTYYRIEPERAHDQRLSRLDLLRKEIAARRNPATLLALAEDLRTIAAGTTLDSTDSLIIDLTRYHPYIVEIDGYSELPEPGSRQQALLTTETLELTFANGEMRYQPQTPDEVDATVNLDAPVSVTFGSTGTARLPAGTPLRIQAREGVTTLTAFAHGGGSVTYRETAFSGGWNYRASHENGAWTWSWSYSGSGKIKGEEYSLSLVFPSQGKPKASLEKLEMMP